MNYSEKFNEWLVNADEETVNELKTIADNAEIEDRFYRDLEFGTGGLRGVMGAGTNRMNKYTIGKVTQGLCDYVISSGSECMERGEIVKVSKKKQEKSAPKNSAAYDKLLEALARLADLVTRYRHATVVDITNLTGMINSLTSKVESGKGKKKEKKKKKR